MIESYEKDLRAKIFRRKFFEKLFYKSTTAWSGGGFSKTKFGQVCYGTFDD